MTIQNRAEVDRIAMSENERNYGYALLTLKIPFDMQYQIGMAGVRGSQRIDFVAFIPPRSAAIFIQGSHWHGGRNAVEDRLKQASAEQAGFWVLLVSEADSDTYDKALAHAKRNLV
jgi:G:T-mismatch repair DNA endonuclease (very short patch repair protein)